MTFDPFNDFETRGYLRNHAGTKDPDVVRRLEHNAFSGNIERALQALRDAPQINLEQVKDAHRILFEDVYPWAGQDRSQNAPQLGIAKGDIEFQLAPYVPRGIEHALKNGADPKAFRTDPGKVIGELAYAHPFLEGNGRTITAVVSELSYRAGFHVAWEQTNKQDYLRTLTKELNDPGKGHLSEYLKPFVLEGALDIARAARTLTTLPGLSDPNLERGRVSTPTLTIVAGPNGAGKSSLTASGIFGGTPVVDPDALARRLNPEDPASVSLRAGRLALEERREHLRNGQSFVVETTLAGSSTLALIDEARSNGFRISLKFVGVRDADLAASRVASRVATGGHSVPEDDIRRRFDRAKLNLPEAISKSDHTEVFENSGKTPHRLVASLERDSFRFEKAPKWVADAAFEAAHRDLAVAETVPELERATSRALEAARAAGVTAQQEQREVKNLERVQNRKRTREGHDL